MAERKKRPTRSKNAINDRSLKELAREASRHLDEVFPGGVVENPSHSDGVSERSAKSGNREDLTPAAGTKHSKALVAHVSPGVARILANILNHMGLDAQVADATADIGPKLGSDQWDIVFAQGTAMPYPGRKISLAALNHCTERGTPVVLLSRRGERLIAEAAGSTAAGLLEWPFSAEKVAKVLAEAIPK